jgi:hypothetical protein
MTRLTVEHEAQIRAYPYKWHDGSLASHHVVALMAELDAVRAERDEARERPHGHEDAGWKRADACDTDLAAAQARLAEIQTFVLEQKRRTESTDNGDDNPLNQRDLYDSLLERLGTAQVEAPHAVESQAGRPMLQPMVPDWMRAEQAEATLAAIRAVCQQWHRKTLFAKQIRALLDAPLSPEKG